MEDITDNQTVVGSLNYTVLATRPDISYAVGALSCYKLRPFASHSTAAKRVLQYLKSRPDCRIDFNRNGIDICNRLVGYSDSDWANDRADRTSQGGHGFLTRNGAIPWQSQKQTLIAMSTPEAEFIACLEASRDVKWLLQLQKDIHGFQKHSPPLPINCDNEGSLPQITTGMIKAQTKHINFCYHNRRDLHRRRIVNYFYVNTNENVADIVRKALT